MIGQQTRAIIASNEFANLQIFIRNCLFSWICPDRDGRSSKRVETFDERREDKKSGAQTTAHRNRVQTEQNHQGHGCQGKSMQIKPSGSWMKDKTTQVKPVGSWMNGKTTQIKPAGSR